MGKVPHLVFSVYAITSSGMPPISTLRRQQKTTVQWEENFKSKKYSTNYVFSPNIFVSFPCVYNGAVAGICFSLLDFCAILSQARRLSDAKVVGKTKRLIFTFER